MLIEFLGDAKLATAGAGCRSWPVTPVSQGSFARRMRIVMQDNARWDGSVRFGARQPALRANPAVVRARGMAAESACRAEGARCRRKKLRHGPNHGAGILVAHEIEWQ